MFKNFFYFTRGQRIGIIMLILLIFIVFILNFLIPYIYPIKDLADKSFIVEVERFKQSLVLRDSVRAEEWRNFQRERQLAYEEKYKINSRLFESDFQQSKYELFKFNPNYADSVQFVRLGIKPFIASNILKYRKLGGVFKTKIEFSKVYGLLPEKYKELEPYIVIENLKTDTIQLRKFDKKVKNLVVDINTADTTQLLQVNGIGRGYAKAIVRLRRELGGFVSINQLMEVYGMNEQNFERIKPFLIVSQNIIKKISVNTATIERLNVHPYLNFYQSKAIYELRRRKGQLHSINDLRNLTELNNEVLNKIEPYLSFE